MDPLLTTERKSVITPAGIHGFFGEYRFLSNFYVCNVELDGIIYPSSEHAFMAEKTEDVEVKKQIAALETPGEAKWFGQTVKLRPKWDEIRVVAMYRVNWAKYAQNSELAKALLATEPKYLEETNDWNDTFWGVCNGKGKNKLGKVLMRVRGGLEFRVFE